jgi:hypothetical protein
MSPVAAGFNPPLSLRGAGRPGSLKRLQGELPHEKISEKDRDI